MCPNSLGVSLDFEGIWTNLPWQSDQLPNKHGIITMDNWINSLIIVETSN
jgi:hypothetical protein